MFFVKSIKISSEQTNKMYLMKIDITISLIFHLSNERIHTYVRLQSHKLEIKSKQKEKNPS